MRRRHHAPKHTPEPPTQLPPARTVQVPGRGEVFARDTGGDGTPILLLHGWTVSADLNWWAQYGPLAQAGFRVIAVDHRGHGRGIRTLTDFRLHDCADDAIGVLEVLGIESAVVAGYSMGGPIALLAAHRHRARVRAIVLCATSSNWRSARLRLFWNAMSLMRLALQLAPYRLWRAGLRAAGLPDDAHTTWAAGELVRGSARDIAEAGRELGRFDARPWVGSLDVPAAVVVTDRDDAVPPAWQRDLAKRLGAPAVEVRGDHLVSGSHPAEFNRGLLAALARLGYPSAVAPVDVVGLDPLLGHDRRAQG